MLFLFSIIGYSQSNCSKYYPFKEGAKFTYTNYNKKGNDSMDFAYDITCDGNGISKDYNSLGNMTMLKQFESMETEITEPILFYPMTFRWAKITRFKMNMKISMEITMEINVKAINGEISSLKKK